MVSVTLFDCWKGSHRTKKRSRVNIAIHEKAFFCACTRTIKNGLLYRKWPKNYRALSRSCKLRKPPRLVAMVSEKKPSVLDGWLGSKRAKKRSPTHTAVTKKGWRSLDYSFATLDLRRRGCCRNVHTQRGVFFTVFTPKEGGLLIYKLRTERKMPSCFSPSR